jgi:hypothetical protein
MTPTFPAEGHAPLALRFRDELCGPLAAWQVLAYFGYSSIAPEILAASRFDPQVGTHSIGLAVVLAQSGLRVEFFSDPDPEPTPVERGLYAQAKALGIEAQVSLPIAALLERITAETIAIVFYQADPAAPYGHFSPLLGATGDDLILPNELETMSSAQLEAARTQPGILRQCILASRAGAT